MEIVSGKARGLQLRSPDNDAVRPTSVRARKALFDSLGNMNGVVFADFFAGSGAVGLEAASRGAGEVLFVDSARSSCKMILQNCERIRKTGVDSNFNVLNGTLPAFALRLRSLPSPDIIFADPPYAESGELLSLLTENPDFTEWAKKTLLIWEQPDGAFELRPPHEPWRLETIKQLGPTRFLMLKVRDF